MRRLARFLNIDTQSFNRTIRFFLVKKRLLFVPQSRPLIEKELQISIPKIVLSLFMSKLGYRQENADLQR